MSFVCRHCCVGFLIHISLWRVIAQKRDKLVLLYPELYQPWYGIGKTGPSSTLLFIQIIMSQKTSGCVQVWRDLRNSLNPYKRFKTIFNEISLLSEGYVAGFVDPEIRDRSDLFDVYVNLPESEIAVSQNAKGESFNFTYLLLVSYGISCLLSNTSIFFQRQWLWENFIKRQATLFSKLQRMLIAQIHRLLR